MILSHCLSIISSHMTLLEGRFLYHILGFLGECHFAIAEDYHLAWLGISGFESYNVRFDRSYQWELHLYQFGL